MEALAYDAATIIVDLVTEGNTEIRDDLRDSLSRIQLDYPGITGTTSFSETGEAKKIPTNAHGD